MSDTAQQRLISFLAEQISRGMSRQLADRFVEVPERRGPKEDILEAAVKVGTAAASTTIASVLVRRLFRCRGV